MENTKSPPQASDATGQKMILDWMNALGNSAKTQPCWAALDFDGIDALDVLLSAIYLAVLNAVRRGPPKHEPAARLILSRARRLAYRARFACREQWMAWKSAPVSQIDTLFWSRDITHTIILHPVAAALAREGATYRMLACQSKVFEGLRQRDANSVYTLGAWPAIVRAARREGARRSKRLAVLGEWKMPDFPGGSKHDVTETVRSAVIRFLPLVSEAIANAHAALDRFRPKVLVVGNDLTLEGRAACRVAAARGVPTAMFMHGSITGDGLQALHCADRVLVNGNIHRHELMQQGIAPERIVVCGAPNLDQRPQQTHQVHPLLQARLGIRADAPWILVATSGPGHRISHRHHHAVISNLVRLSAANPGVPVVVKLHRKDRLAYYQQDLKDCPLANLVIVAEDAFGFPRDIFEWLQGCRVVLTGASAVAVEAMLMNVPVVTMDFCDEIHDVDFIDAKATTHVRTLEALESAVRDILAKPKSPAAAPSHVQHYLQEAFHALDGNSAGRGAKALCEMGQRHTP